MKVGAAVRHPSHRLEELAHVGDSLLEQVSDSRAARVQEVARVAFLDAVALADETATILIEDDTGEALP